MVGLQQRLTELVGASAVRELRGGHQSQVFEAIGPPPRMVVKVHDASMVDRPLLEARVETTAELAEVDARVCQPLPLDGRLVTAVDVGTGFTGLVTCYAYATGTTPDVESPDDAARMGSTLASLHESMRSVARKELPLVAALATARPDWTGPTQLLHGDFRAANLRFSEDGRVGIFDFDDCGFGPPAFDVANALYTVLFDVVTKGRPGAFSTFSEAFLSGYDSVDGEQFGPEDVRGFIDLRVGALESWLENPATAPIGVCTSSPEWMTTLRSFVAAYGARRREAPGGSPEV